MLHYNKTYYHIYNKNHTFIALAAEGLDWQAASGWNGGASSWDQHQQKSERRQTGAGLKRHHWIHRE